MYIPTRVTSFVSFRVSQTKSDCNFPKTVLKNKLSMANNAFYGENSDVSAILFDLDNTLIQTRKGDTRACNKLVEILQQQYGLPQDEAVESGIKFLRAFRARPDDETYILDEWPAHLWRNSLPKNYRHIAKNISTEWIKLRFQCLTLTNDVIHLLESLREDYLLGLITNGPSRAQWQKIEKLKLRKYFDCVLVSGDLPWEKPDQHIFLEACKLLSVEPRMCIMVGDKLETDIRGGKDAELGGTVWIPLQPDEESSDLPDFTIDNVTELPEVLPNSPKLKRSAHPVNKC